MASVYQSLPVKHLERLFNAAERDLGDRLEAARTNPGNIRLYTHMQACKIQMSEIVKKMEEREIPDIARYRDRLENPDVTQVLRLMENVQRRMFQEGVDSKKEDCPTVHDLSRENPLRTIEDEEVALRTIRTFCNSIDIARMNAVTRHWNVGPEITKEHYLPELKQDVEKIWVFHQTNRRLERVNYRDLPPELGAKFDETLSKHLENWIEGNVSYQWGKQALRQLAERSRTCLHGKIIEARFRPTLNAFIRFQQIDHTKEHRNAHYIHIVSSLLQEGRVPQAMVFIRQIMVFPDGQKDVVLLMRHFLAKNQPLMAGVVARAIQTIEGKTATYYKVVVESMIGEQLDQAGKVLPEFSNAEARDIWKMGIIFAHVARGDYELAAALAEELSGDRRGVTLVAFKWINGYIKDLLKPEMQNMDLKGAKPLCVSMLNKTMPRPAKMALGTIVIKHLLANGKIDDAIALMKYRKTFYFCDTYCEHLITEALAGKPKYYRMWKLRNL